MIRRSFFKSRHLPFRIHMDADNSIQDLANKISDLLPEQSNKDIVIICIGTDRSTGDSLGPLIGSNLRARKLKYFHIYGTLEEPVHAVNLEDKITEIYERHDHPFVIAIDACLGRSTSVGMISIADGPVKPGAAVNKNLPPVGDIHINGIVNVGGYMEYMVLQNTRLHFVIKMADIIADSIYFAEEELSKHTRRTLLKPVNPKFFSS